MNIAHHQRQKCYSRNELQGIQILRTKSDRIGQEGEKRITTKATSLS